LFLSVSFFVPAVVIVACPDAPDTVAASASFPIKAEMQKCLWFVNFPKKPLINQIKSATIKIDKKPRETGKIYLRKGKTERVNALTEKSIFMKMRKVISTVLAGVLALSALPISAMSVGAEGAYAPGDVDMDGVITGHDAAVVSRYLHVDNTLLNADQLALADVNGDGVVDQADADWIHENEEVELGACDISVPNPTSLFYQLVYIANTGAGNHFTIVDEDISTEQIFDLKISQKNFNLLDVTGDGKIDLDDINGLGAYIGHKGAGFDLSRYFATGRYDYDITEFAKIYGTPKDAVLVKDDLSDLVK